MSYDDPRGSPDYVRRLLGDETIKRLNEISLKHAKNRARFMEHTSNGLQRYRELLVVICDREEPIDNSGIDGDLFFRNQTTDGRFIGYVPPSSAEPRIIHKMPYRVSTT